MKGIFTHESERMKYFLARNLISFSHFIAVAAVDILYIVFDVVVADSFISFNFFLFCFGCNNNSVH